MAVLTCEIFKKNSETYAAKLISVPRHWMVISKLEDSQRSAKTKSVRHALTRDKAQQLSLNILTLPLTTSTFWLAIYM
jgi:hypothetical protein